MATKTRTKTKKPVRGFGSQPARKRGSGWSAGVAHTFFQFIRREELKSVTEIVAERRNEDQDAYSSYRGKFDRHGLMNPPHGKKLLVKDAETPMGPVKYFKKGFWGVSFSKRRNDKYPIFSIVVWSGDTYRFLPDVIERDIRRNCGDTAYTEWKHAVMANWSDLVEVMLAATNWLTLSGYKFSFSHTSSERSADLCRKLGIRVDEGVAFLFPHYGEDLFSCSDQRPLLTELEAMEKAGATAREIVNAVVRPLR